MEHIKTGSAAVTPSGACGKSDNAFIPQWAIALEQEKRALSSARAWERTEREKTADDRTIALTAGWLELARRKGKKIKVELLAVGLEWLRGDCSQEKAIHAAFGGNGPLSEAQRKMGKKRRDQFVEFCRAQGIDVSYLTKG